MIFTDIARRAGRSLTQAKARTLLTSLAIAVGAFTIMASLAAGEGTRTYSDNLIKSNVDPQSIFVTADESMFEGGMTGGGLREYDPNVIDQGGISLKMMSQDDVDKLSGRSDLSDVVPIYQLSVRSVEFEGSDKQYTADFQTYNPDVISQAAAGKVPERGKDIGKGHIILPESFADSLDKKPSDLVGTTVTLTIAQPPQDISEDEITRILASEGPEALSEMAQGSTKTVDLEVVALTKQDAMNIAAPSAASVSAETAREIAEFTSLGTDYYQKYLGVTAKVSDGKDPNEVKSALVKEDYAAQTAEDLQSLIFTIVNVLQGIVMGFGVLALIASVFGIINTQYISVLERTSQIGLMKALGMRGRDVSKLFRYEAAWIGFLGGVIGIALAWIAGTLANPWITETLGLGEGNYLLEFVWWHALILLAGLILVAILAGYFPSRKAAKLDPIEALRTE